MENERAPLFKFAIGTKTASKLSGRRRGTVFLHGLMKLHCFSNQPFVDSDINSSRAFVFV